MGEGEVRLVEVVRGLELGKQLKQQRWDNMRYGACRCAVRQTGMKGNKG